MKGAEALVRAGKFAGKACLVKQRLPKAYRVPALDNSLRRSRTAREAKILAKAKEAVRCPLVLHVDADAATLWLVPVEGTLARNVKLSAKMLKAIGGDLAKLHALGIVHGDCTTSNILVGAKGVAWIDFGLSEFSSSVEERATDLALLKRSLSAKEFAVVVAGYAKAPFARDVLARLQAIEERGRYVVRALSR